MPESVFKKHLIVDLKTGFSYGLMVNAEGVCKTIEALDTLILKPGKEGRTVADFSPMDLPEEERLPYGKTTHAIEMTQSGKDGKIFTLVWPTQEKFKAGERPAVAMKDLPPDLVKSGVAPAPKGVKGEKRKGIESEEDLKGALKNIDAMIGLGKAKNDIRQNIALTRFNMMKEELGLATKPISRHMVFTGNPGTGKTTFAREVAKVYHALGLIEKAEVHEVKREDLVAGYVGQTAIKTKEAIEKAKGGILFIDEAYALARDAGPGSDGRAAFGAEAIDTLVAAMENMREDLIVIVAGYSEPMKKFINANEGLKSRFMTYIEFDDYGMPELGQILDTMAKDRGYTMDADAREHAMKLLETEKNRAKKEFGNGRTVRNLVEKAEKELALRLQNENKLIKDHGLSVEDIKAQLTTITLKDVQLVSLEGLASKKVENGEMGLGTSRPKPAAPTTPVANDIKPPAPAVVSAKGKLRNNFGM